MDKLQVRRPPGIIQSDALYTIAEIEARLKLGHHALRVARRNGLPVRYIGRRAYLLGSDLLTYVEKHAKASQ